MRNSNRIDGVLADIKKIWAKYPDLRLGQLLCNVIRDPALYYVEDDELVKCLEEYYGQSKRKDDSIKKDGQ